MESWNTAGIAMTISPAIARLGRKKYWGSMSSLERSRKGKRLRCQKGALHAARVLALQGHWLYLQLCRRKWREVNKGRALKRKLAPAECAQIRKDHAEEIAASARPHWR